MKVNYFVGILLAMQCQKCLCVAVSMSEFLMHLSLWFSSTVSTVV